MPTHSPPPNSHAFSGLRWRTKTDTKSSMLKTATIERTKFWSNYIQCVISSEECAHTDFGFMFLPLLIALATWEITVSVRNSHLLPPFGNASRTSHPDELQVRGTLASVSVSVRFESEFTPMSCRDALASVSVFPQPESFLDSLSGFSK